MAVRGKKLRSLKARRRKRLLTVGGSVLLVALLCVYGAIAWYAQSEYVAITEIHVEGNKTLNSEHILALAEGVLAQPLLFFIDRRNVLFVPKRKIQLRLLESDHRIRDVEVNTTISGILSITITEREPKYVYCSGELPDGSATSTPPSPSSCFFADTDGYIFEAAPKFSGNLFLTLYGTPTSSPVVYPPVGPIEAPLGMSFASSAYLGKISLLIKALESLEMSTVAVAMMGEGDIVIITSDGLKIYFNDKKGLVRSIGDLQSVIDVLPEHDDSARWSDLEYIDLRFGNKAFYK